MNNKYLEKIARDLSKEELHNAGTRTYWTGAGGGVVGGMVVPVIGGIAGSVAGRSHALAKLKTRITGNETKVKDVLDEGIRSEARAQGRGIVEGLGGAGVGGAIGAGLGGLITRSGEGATIGGAIGGGLGVIAGGVHGGWRSTHNSVKDFAKEWKQEQADKANKR